WSPTAAQALAAPDSDGHDWTLAGHRGRNVVVLFFLGGKCAHCMQQLDLFGKASGDLGALEADVVAVSSDDGDATRALKRNADKIVFPMPVLPDPGLDLFKKYHAFDDFEGQPVHAIYLVDRRGEVRYRRISAEPFLDVDFVKSELARVNRLVAAS